MNTPYYKYSWGGPVSTYKVHNIQTLETLIAQPNGNHQKLIKDNSDMRTFLLPIRTIVLADLVIYTCSRVFVMYTIHIYI